MLNTRFTKNAISNEALDILELFKTKTYAPTWEHNDHSIQRNVQSPELFSWRNTQLRWLHFWVILKQCFNISQIYLYPRFLVSSQLNNFCPISGIGRIPLLPVNEGTNEQLIRRLMAKNWNIFWKICSMLLVMTSWKNCQRRLLNIILLYV